MRWMTMWIAMTGLAATAHAADPHTMPDDAWVALSGTAEHTRPDGFILDYGEGEVTVEVDDWDSYQEARALMDGDEVTVYGKIDHDLYELAKIEAGSVYVDNLNMYLRASSDDEETLAWTMDGPVIASYTTVRGTVANVDEDSNRLAIATGDDILRVDLDGIGYNAVDDKGFQQIDPGDRVKVVGEIDQRFFTGPILDADRVITLVDRSNGG